MFTVLGLQAAFVVLGPWRQTNTGWCACTAPKVMLWESLNEKKWYWSVRAGFHMCMCYLILVLWVLPRNSVAWRVMCGRMSGAEEAHQFVQNNLWDRLKWDLQKLRRWHVGERAGRRLSVLARRSLGKPFVCLCLCLRPCASICLCLLSVCLHLSLPLDLFVLLNECESLW